jgi:thiol-disulfide isomerase/thioredoxin
MRILCTGLVMLIGLSGKAQIKELKVGDKFPETTVDVINDKVATRIIGGASGKHTILDFWATWCKPCVADLPKLDSIQDHYKGKLQLLPVNIENREKAKFLIEKLKTMDKFMLPSVVDEPALYKHFPFSILPHLVWIDDQGTVVAITDSKALITNNIEKFIKNEPLNLKAKNDYQDKRPLKFDKPFLSQFSKLDIPDSITQYYSSLSKYDAKLPSAFGGNGTMSQFMYSNAAIVSLYKLAYGNRKNDLRLLLQTPVIIKSRDSTKISYPKEVKNWTSAEVGRWNSENCFTYDISVPLNRKSEIFDLMKQDLDRYFGYSINIEKKTVKCYVLKSLDVSLYSTKGGEVVRDLNQFYMKYQNVGMKWLVIDLVQYFQNTPYKVVDQTGYSGKIDLELKDIDFSKPELVSKALKKSGLSLTLEDVEQEVVIIGDKK